MSNKTNEQKDTKSNENKVQSVKKFDLDNVDERKYVQILNLSPWEVYFIGLQSRQGTEIRLQPNGMAMLDREEIRAQFQKPNTLFTGRNGDGAHATIYINDELTRRWLGIESDGKKQCIFTLKTAKEIFKLPQAQYEIAVKEKVKTRAEKFALISAIKELNLNDYKKIVFAEHYTTFKV